MKQERVQVIYESLETLFIELDRDPVARGPAYLQDLISKTRGYLNQTGYYMQEIQRERHSLEMDLDAQEAAFEVKKAELLAGDARVSRLPAIEDRLAMIDVLLGSERREIQRLKREIKNLNHVDKVVRHRHKELDNTMSAIRLQKQLVDAELRTGSFYGDENEVARGNKWVKPGAADEPPVEDFSEEEIRQLLSGEDILENEESSAAEEETPKEAEAPKETLEETPKEVVPDEEPSDEAGDDDAADKDIVKFLDGEDDLSDLFENL